MNLGDLCHVEIRTHSVSASREFYGKVFDWAFQGGQPSYEFLDPGVGPRGALCGVEDPEKALGTNNGICAYFLVADCATSEAQVVAMGGKVVVSQMAVPGMGRFSVTVDPWANETGFWEAAPGSSPPAGPRHTGKNGFCWVEVSVKDLPAAIAYYKALFGWNIILPGGSDYAFREHGGETVGVGIMGGDGAKHVKGSTTYVDVDDLKAYTKKVTDAGGKVVYGPQAIPGTGRFTMCKDLEGNRFALFFHDKS